MNAADYAKHSGYPAQTIKNLLKQGVLPHDHAGRVYIINVELADQILLDRQRNPQIKVKDVDTEKVIPLTRGKKFDFLDALKKAR